MVTSPLDLDAYFERIHWSGGRSPTFETLAGILRAHTARIPFENLDVLLRRGVRLDLESVQAKLVRAGRGGYCFEHATLFYAVLETLGFQPVRHDARVVLFEPRTEASRTHMFLTVRIGHTRFVVDPGFGPFKSTDPLPLTDARVGRGTHWLTREGELWTLHAPKDGEIVPAWVTTLEEAYPVDFELANHFIATHPASPFVNWIMLSAVTPDGVVNVMNRDVTIMRGGEAHRERLADRTALRRLLTEHFGFDLPEVENMTVPAIPEWQ